MSVSLYGIVIKYIQLLVLFQYHLIVLPHAYGMLVYNWDASGRQVRERDIYRQANKEAKKEVARSKAHAMDDIQGVGTPEGERKIYRIAKARENLPKISRR